MLSANHQNGMDDFILAIGEWPPLIGQSVQVPTARKHFAFRREFRPLDILQFVFLTCFTFSTEGNTAHIGWGPVLVVLVFVLGFVFGFLFGCFAAGGLAGFPHQFAVFPFLLR